MLTQNKKSGIGLLLDALDFCIDKHAEITIIIRPNRIEHINYTIKNIPKNKNVSRETIKNIIK